MQRVVLDSVGPSDAYAQYQHVLLMLRQQAGLLAPLFASYQAVAPGASGTGAWWTELQGQARAQSDLSPVQQQALRARWTQAVDRLRGLVRSLDGRGAGEQARALASFLDSGLTGALYDVGGKPLWVLSQNPEFLSQPLIQADTTTAMSAPLRAGAAAEAAPLAADLGADANSHGVPEHADQRQYPSRWPYYLAALLLLILLVLLCWWFKWPAFAWGAGSNRVSPAAETLNQGLSPESGARVGPGGVPVSASLAPICAKDEEGRTLGPELYIVFDTSGSMRLSVDASIEDQDWFFEMNEEQRQALTGDARRRAQDLFLGTTRIDAARQAFAAMVDGLPARQDIHLVSFSPDCRPAQYWGGFADGRREQLKSLVRGIEPENSTNLADALSLAASRIDGVERDALIVLFVDGGDGCEKDVCALAQELAQTKPRLRINVVDITGQGLAACVAQATGGIVLAPQQASQIPLALREATVEAVERTAQACR
ncbi:VWA domain-containing protein [Alcaligenes sp. SDU_A2]|uniref:VWA domain-containing protein n=1 Tax=Alcaligenes sp. SDU_A2 TaxID=3136634 RepID=UPI00311D61A1